MPKEQARVQRRRWGSSFNAGITAERGTTMPPVRTSPSVAPAPSSPLLVGHGCSQGGYRVGPGRARAVLLQWDKEPVSYTHLTLPTICSV
eukprot:7738047-Alexandrium_andersonii.AAC.1